MQGEVPGGRPLLPPLWRASETGRNRLIKRIAILMILSLLSLSAPALAAEAGTGIIEGQLVNETEGGSSVADQEVTMTTSW